MQVGWAVSRVDGAIGVSSMGGTNGTCGVDSAYHQSMIYMHCFMFPCIIHDISA